MPPGYPPRARTPEGLAVAVPVEVGETPGDGREQLLRELGNLGEETGELDKMLIKIADTYDEEVDASVAAMMAMMEPALIIFMGGAVGFIVIALFMPLIQLMQNLGGG